MIISGVILAAGKSTRFPGNKMTREIVLGGVKAPILKHTVSKFLRTHLFDELVVVLGHNREEVMEVVSDVPGLKYVISVNYDKGMSFSVKAGVSAEMKYSDIVAIHPGDVPFILTDTLRNLIEVAVEEFSQRKDFIVIPKYTPKGKGGHPLIVGRALVPHIMEISEEGRGLKSFLSRFRGRIKYVETEDLGVLADIDTPQDLERDKPLIEREGG
jgi:molybdenum cofactor cytidylyltransferase